eukprot:4055643-Ditylum_brightwellii.AAC.1
MQSGIIWNNYASKCWVKDRHIEPLNPQQNPDEQETMIIQKEKLARFMLILIAIKELGLGQHIMLQMFIIILHQRN